MGVGGECDVGTLDDAVGKGQSAGEGEEEVEEVEGLLGGPAALGDAPVNTNELEEGGGGEQGEGDGEREEGCDQNPRVLVQFSDPAASTRSASEVWVRVWEKGLDDTICVTSVEICLVLGTR